MLRRTNDAVNRWLGKGTAEPQLKSQFDHEVIAHARDERRADADFEFAVEKEKGRPRGF